MLEPLFRGNRHVTLLGEWVVAVVAIVGSERQIAECVQPGLLDALPILAERFLPLRREVLVLREDMFNGVLVYRHALFATVILQTAQPIAATAEVVEVSGLQITPELVVCGEAAVGRQSQEVRLNTLEIAVLLHGLGERSECFVHRVGGNGADGTTEHVRLH